MKPLLNEDLSAPPAPLIPSDQWADFCEWAREGGYDQPWFNRWDSKSVWLQEQYLEEQRES